MQNIKPIYLQIMPPSMTESLGASKKLIALYSSSLMGMNSVFNISNVSL